MRRFHLLTGLLLTLCGMLWAAFPWYAPGLIRWVAAGQGAHVQHLAIDRPGLRHLRIDHLRLSVQGLDIEMQEAMLRWNWSATAEAPGILDGHLQSVHIGSLRATEIDPPEPPNRSGAPSTPAESPPLNPTELREWLAQPLHRRLGIESVRIDALVAEHSGVRISDGDLALDARGFRAQARMDHDGLMAPLAARIELQGQDRLTAELETWPGSSELPGLALDIRVGAETGELQLEEARFDTRRLPIHPLLLDGQIRDLVAQGDLKCAVQPEADAIDIACERDSRVHLEARVIGMPAPLPDRLSLGFSLDAPWQIRWRNDEIASLGAAPRLQVRADGAELDVLLRELLGPIDALRVHTAFSSRLELGDLAGAARGEIALDLGGASPTVLQGSHAIIEHARLADPDVEATNVRVDLRSDVAATLDTRATAEIRASAMAIEGRTITLDSMLLTIDAQISQRAQSARFELIGPGIRIPGGLQYTGEEWALDLTGATLDLARASLLQTLVQGPLPGARLNAGTVRVDGSLTAHLTEGPPVVRGSVQTRLDNVGLSSPQGSLGAVGGEIDARFEDHEVHLHGDVASGTLDLRPTSDTAPLRGAGLHIEGSLLASVGVGHALTMDPTSIEAQVAIDGELDRATWDGYATDAMRLHLTANGSAARHEAHALLAAESVEAGIRMHSVTCEVQWLGDSAEVHACGANLLGGHVEISRGEIDMQTLDGYLPTAIHGLELPEVLALLENETVGGEGQLDGAVPLRLDQGAPSITDGFLGARPPGGRLRWNAAPALRESLKQSGLQVAVDALADFRYTQLIADVDYASDGTLDLGVRVSGANPAFENGRPVALNLNVSQNLIDLLQSLRLSQNIDSSIQRRFDPSER